MRKLLLNLVMIFAISCIAKAQSFEWGKQFGGDGDDVVRNMVVDNEGNTYITGYFWYTIVFSTEPNEISITSNGFSDIFLAKVNKDGDVVWAKNFGGNDNDYANGISLDAEGNILLTGAFQQTANFNPSGGGGVLTSNGVQDIFVLKLNPEGNFIWVKGFGSSNYEESESVSYDAAGNIYLAGYFFSEIDFDPSSAEYIMTPTSTSGNGFIMKMNGLGEFEWAKQIGGTDSAYTKFIKVMENGEIYVLGSYTGTCDLNPGPDEFLVTSAAKDIYVLHLDSSGNFLNVHTSAALDESGNTEVFRLDVDSFGDIYVIGNFVGTIDFDPLETGQGDFTLTSDSFFYNGFLLKMKSSGEAAWVKKVGGSDMILMYDVAVSEQNDIFLTGFFTADANFDTITILQESPNLMDAFVAQINRNGEFQSAYPFGGTDGGDGHEIEIGPSNTLNLSSSFHQTVDLNPLEGEQFVTITGEDGYRDIYVIKLEAGTLGLNTISEFDKVQFFPNPAENNVKIIGNESFAGKEYKVYDVTGKKVSHGEIDFMQQIPLHTLSKGTYVLIIDSYYRFKVIKK